MSGRPRVFDSWIPVSPERWPDNQPRLHAPLPFTASEWAQFIRVLEVMSPGMVEPLGATLARLAPAAVGEAVSRALREPPYTFAVSS